MLWNDFQPGSRCNFSAKILNYERQIPKIWKHENIERKITKCNQECWNIKMEQYDNKEMLRISKNEKY